MAKAKAEKDSVKLESSIAANQEGLAEVEAEVEKLNESLREVKDYVADIRAKVEAAQAGVENSKDDLEELKVELDQKTEEVQAFRAIEVRQPHFLLVIRWLMIRQVELTQRLNDKKTELKENRTTMDRSQAEHDKLRLEDVEYVGPFVRCAAFLICS